MYVIIKDGDDVLGPYETEEIAIAIAKAFSFRKWVVRKLHYNGQE